MSESKKNESSPISEQNPTDEAKDAEKARFEEAVKGASGDKGLEDAFRILSKGEPEARVEEVFLKLAVNTRGATQFSIQNAMEIIQKVNEEGLLTSKQFVDMVNMIVTMEAAMKKNDDNGLKEAFDAIEKYGPVTAAHVLLAVTARDAKHLDQKAKDMIQQVNKQGQFNRDEFIDVFKWLDEPGDDDQTKNIYKNLTEADNKEKIIVYGSEGVGKTWTEREVSSLAVRNGEFDASIWVYLDRSYEDDLSLHKSIASQLSVLADFEQFEADEAEKKKDAEEAKKNEKAVEEPKKKEEEPKKSKKDVRDEVVMEANARRDMIESLIKVSLEGKRILFVWDDNGGVNTMRADINVEFKHEKPKSGDEQKPDEGDKNTSNVGENKEVEEKKREEGDKICSSDEEKKKAVEESKEREESSGADEKKKKGKEEKEVVVLKLSDKKNKSIRVELGCLKSYKILTTVRSHPRDTSVDSNVVKPLSWEKSKSLASRAMVREEVTKNVEELEELAGYFMFRSKRLPAHLLLISRIVSYLGKKGESELAKLRSDRAKIKTKGGTNLLDILIKRYHTRLPKDVLIDCYSPEALPNHFMRQGRADLRQGRAVTFNELICYWIMEGHLGHSGPIDELYLIGHRVLMELMNCGLLQKQEADYVAWSGATSFNFHIFDYRTFFSSLRLGLGVTFDMSLGRVALAEGMIRTTSSTISKKGNKNKEPRVITSLLLDGNRIGEEERPMESLCRHKDLVQVLAISDPTSQHFELPILEMRELRLLALRGCQFLPGVEPFLEKKSDQEEKDQSVPDKKSDPENDQSLKDPIPKKPDDRIPQNQISEKLERLTFLEISGPSPVKTIPGELFSLVPNLKTLNMSHLHQVQELPSSFFKLTKIEFLILRGCKNLKELRTLKSFILLKVLDVSDAASFEKFEDKSLHSNTDLRILNLSKTKLKTLPLINQLKNLKFVWLGDCQVLPRIRKIDKMEKLKVFDISGAEDVERFCDPSLEELNNLLILDISRTKIRRLPANLGDPTYLYAKNCLKLKVVPPVEGLNKIKILDLSGCAYLREVRTEFFAKVKGLKELNLSNTKVELLPFLSSLVSLRRLFLSECRSLKNVEGLSCLVKLEYLNLSGCENVMELEKSSFDNMSHLHLLNLSKTGLGVLPSLSKLVSLKELHVRDCPNLTELPGVEEVTNLEVVDYSGTVLKSPPSFKNQDHPRVVGAGIESIDTIELFRNLGATGTPSGKWYSTPEEVRHCKWIISNWRMEETDKLGTNVYGVHFDKLLKKHPSFLTEILSKFYFLVYPSEPEAEARVKARFPNNSYSDEVSLREIYINPFCEKRMEKCLEIREFNELPESLRPLIAKSEFIVLVDNKFLTSLLDLHLGSNDNVRACWIESCNELKHVVAAPEKEEKTEEVVKSEELRKNDGAAGKSTELVKDESDQLKKVAAQKASDMAKGEGDQQKSEKSAENPKDGCDQQKNSAAGEMIKGEGNEEKNAPAQKESLDSVKSEVDEQKPAAEEKSVSSAKNEGDQPKNGSTDIAGGSGKGEGDDQKNAAEEKSGDLAKSEVNEQAKNEVDQAKNATALEAKDSEKVESDQQKSTAEEKSGKLATAETDEQTEQANEQAKNEGDQPKNATALEAKDAEKVKGDKQKNKAEEKSEFSAKNEADKQIEEANEQAKNEGDQPKDDTALEAKDAEKVEGDKQKNKAEEKSEFSAKNEADEQIEEANEQAKNEGDQPKDDTALEAKDSEKVEGGNVVAEGKSEKQAMNEGDQPKNALADNAGDSKKIQDEKKLADLAKNDDAGESAKVEGGLQKNVSSKSEGEGEEVKNAAKELNKLEILWVSDVSIMERLCKGDSKSVNFNSLKSLYLEFCPNLYAICSSSLQLQSLENLYIRYCQNLETLFEDDNPSKMVNLSHMQLWGLNSLQKINCKTPALRKLRVGECPLLEHVISSRLKEQYETEGHETLETLHVKSCNRLKGIFEEEGEGKDAEFNVEFKSLKELELWGLPKLQKVARTARMLQVLRVGDCPSLRSVITGANGVPNLNRLEVRSCEKMATIVGGKGSKLENAKEIDLFGLPELTSVGAELPGKEGCKESIWACPKLRRE